MGKKKDKERITNELEAFFNHIKEKTPEDVRKAKRRAMSINYKLKERRKAFCKECHTPYTSKTSKTRIKDGKKIILCENCGKTSRWKL